MRLRGPGPSQPKRPRAHGSVTFRLARFAQVRSNRELKPQRTQRSERLIAAPTDALSSTTMPWQSGSTTPTPQKTYFTGEANTNAILTNVGTFPAASAANGHTVARTLLVGASGNHLPGLASSLATGAFLIALLSGRSAEI